MYKRQASVSIDLPKVNAWHFDFPNLYRIDVTIMSGKKAVDRIAANTGFRSFEMKDGKVFLNGEAIKLMGVEWTAGSNPNFGFAETDSMVPVSYTHLDVYKRQI